MPLDLLSSLYKVTFSPSSSPLVLVNYGDYIDQELAMVLDRAFEVIDPVDDADVFIRDGKSARYEFSFRVYKAETLDLTARVAAMNSLITVAGLGKKSLRIELQGHSGHYWQFASCGIKRYAPVKVQSYGKARWSKQYDVVASGFTYT